MFNILLLISAIIGTILVLLSQAQDLLLLFSGLAVIIASVIAFLLKKYSRILFFPFIILIGAVLFMFNALDFRANIFNIDFIHQGLYSPSYFVGNSEYSFGVPIPALNDDLLSDFRIQFQQSPILDSNDFILSDYQAAGNRMNAVWYWDGEPKWIQISTADYLHIYDPLINVYYPDEVTALLLVDRLEFSLLDFSSGPVPITTKLSINELYYQTQPIDLRFNSPFKQLIIKSTENLSQPNYEVWVNGKMLTWETSTEGWHIFSVNDPVNAIETLEIIEKSHSVPNDLQILQPSFSAIYAIEKDPAPIVIENISLNKLFARVNISLPVYSWNAQAIQTDFTTNDAIMTQENGSAHLKPDGILTTLYFNQPTEPIIAQGIADLAPFRLWGNVIITFSLLVAYILSALFLNHFLEMIINSGRKWIVWIKKISAQRPRDLNKLKVTPFKLLFFLFLVFSWVLFFTIPFKPLLLLMMVVLSGSCAYFVIKDFEFK